MRLSDFTLTCFVHASHGKMFLPSSSILILFAFVAGFISSCCCSASTAAAVSGGRPIHVLSDGEQATRALQSQSQSATEGICSMCGNVGGPSKLKPEATWDGTFSGFGMMPESSYNDTTCASIEIIANSAVQNTTDASHYRSSPSQGFT